MVDIANDILSLTEFKRRSAELLKRIQETQRPLVLTVNGKAELVVQDAQSYQQMLDLLERAEAIEGIQKGLDSMRGGKSRSLEVVDSEIRGRHSIPS